MPFWQYGSQAPATHERLSTPLVEQASLHAPQCRGSICVFSQPSFNDGLQSTLPVVQLYPQTPPTQVGVLSG